MPLYHLFVSMAKQLNPKYISMIIPARWFAGGMGLDEFRKSMLNDKRLSHLVDYPNASDCFPNVEIKGGVCYFLWNNAHNGLCTVKTVMNNEICTMQRELNKYNVFIRFNKAISVVEKVLNKNIQSLEKAVSSSKPFGLRTFVRPLDIGDINLVANGRTGKYLKSNLTRGMHILSKWKLLLSVIYGAGDGYPHQITGKPILAGPNTACTETYLCIGEYTTEIEGINLEAYLKTKFVRFLIALKKNTQSLTKTRFEFVPQMDMTQLWDDEKLYAYFDITPEEREFIESMIKEMK
jgi:site-specific DNA-methyltransferase (adenine-specific)